VRVSRYASRSAAAAAIVGMAVMAGATACGGSPSANPLAGLTATQIGAKTIADLKAASSVHYAGTITESGETDDVDITAGTTNCVGTLGIVGKGSFVLLEIGQTLWIKPDNQFWTSEGASPAVLQVVEGKYIQTSPNDSDFSSVKMLCSPAQLAASLGSKINDLVKGTTTTVDGQSALQLRDTSDSGVAYVTISASPQFLRISCGSGGQGQLDFSAYDAPVTVSSPPASQTIDGSTIGL
jgi:hypothetical protein